MSYGPLDRGDPFEAGQREALRATDALLDRIGSRAPTPDDLDDPLVAALALMAGEIDLNAVPVENSRAALERDLAHPGLLGDDGVPADSVVDERTGLVLDLRDLDAVEHDPQAAAALRRRLPREAAWRPVREDDDTPRRPRRGVRRPEPRTSGAIAPPRSLPRSGSRPPARPERRERRLRPMTAFVAVLAALILGTGVSAAVTGGRSVNPLTGLQQVVAQLSRGRTQEQNLIYRQDVTHLDRAQAAVTAGDDDRAVAELRQLVLGPPLSPQDVSVLKARADALQHAAQH